MSGCYFEYAQRWPEMRRLLSDSLEDRSAMDRFLDLLEQRDRDLELYLNTCRGGARVYCDHQNKTLDSGTSEAQLEASVEFALAATATVGITVAFSFDADPVAASVMSSSFAWFVDGVLVDSPTPLRSTPVVATATTLDPGDHTIVATLTTGGMNLVDGQVSVLVVIGDDTGADCVQLVGA